MEMSFRFHGENGNGNLFPLGEMETETCFRCGNVSVSTTPESLSVVNSENDYPAKKRRVDLLQLVLI
jgi:hypothetical protein